MATTIKLTSKHPKKNLNYGSKQEVFTNNGLTKINTFSPDNVKGSTPDDALYSSQTAKNKAAQFASGNMTNLSNSEKAYLAQQEALKKKPSTTPTITSTTDEWVTSVDGNSKTNTKTGEVIAKVGGDNWETVTMSKADIQAYEASGGAQYKETSPVLQRAATNANSVAGNVLTSVNEAGDKTTYTRTDQGFVDSSGKKLQPVATTGTEFITEWRLSAPDEDVLKAYSSLLEQTNKTVAGYSSKLQSYERAFENIKQIVADQGEQFNQALMALGQKGMEVDFNSPELAGELQSAVSSGNTDFESILAKYAVDTTKSGGRLTFDDQIQGGVADENGMVKFTTPVSPKQNLGANKTYDEVLNEVIAGMGKTHLTAQEYAEAKAVADQIKQTTPNVDNSSKGTSTTALDVNTQPDVPKTTTELVGEAMTGVTSVGQASLLTTLSAAGVDLNKVTSGQALQILLTQQQLDYANDATTTNYLNEQIESANNAYTDAIDKYNQDVAQIDKIIDGEDIVPSSYEALAAKVYTQQKESALENLDAEREYQEKTYNAYAAQERQKRGRLEGYLKAKLESIGAADTTAGLAMMAIQVNAADLNIQLKEADHLRAMSQLNTSAKEIMTGYANNIAKIAVDLDTKKSEALIQNNDKISEINNLIIENDREKTALKIEAMQSFVTNMAKIDSEMQEQTRWEQEQAYKKTQDAIDNAYKISGMMGTYYSVNSNGDIVNTGVPTIDSKKYNLDFLQYAHDVEYDRIGKAISLVENGMTSSQAEQFLGLQDGSLNGLTGEALVNTINDIRVQREINAFITGENFVDTGSAIANTFRENDSGGQCGVFLQTKVYKDLPKMGNYFATKMKALVNTPVGYIPKVGDVVVQNIGKNGHVFCINAIDWDKRLITKTESNINGDEKITTTKTISLDDPTIGGYGTGYTLADPISNAIKSSQSLVLNDYIQRAKDTDIKTARATLVDSMKGKSDEYKSAILKAFDDRVYEKEEIDLSTIPALNAYVKTPFAIKGVNTGTYKAPSIWDLEQEKTQSGSAVPTYTYGASGVTANKEVAT